MILLMLGRVYEGQYVNWLDSVLFWVWVDDFIEFWGWIRDFFDVRKVYGGQKVNWLECVLFWGV